MIIRQSSINKVNMKEFATDDDFLVKRSNGLLLSNNDVNVLEKYDIDYNSCTSLSELIYLIEDYLEDSDELVDLEELSIKLSEFNYYHNTNK